jgi:hypothetical protein
MISRLRLKPGIQDVLDPIGILRRNYLLLRDLYQQSIKTLESETNKNQPKRLPESQG